MLQKTAELMEMLLDLEEPCIILGVHIVDGSICAAAAVPAVATISVSTCHAFAFAE